VLTPTRLLKPLRPGFLPSAKFSFIISLIFILHHQDLSFYIAQGIVEHQFHVIR
jgi:hypothetical protein